MQTNLLAQIAGRRRIHPFPPEWPRIFLGEYWQEDDETRTTEIRVIYLQGEKFCLFPESADQSGPTPHAAQSTASVSAELSKVLRTEVGQLVLLPMRPQILHRI